MRSRKILFLTVLMLLAGTYISGAATIMVTTTIQDAIDNADDGDVVKIPAGTYNEAIVINDFSKLTITGVGQGVTIIDGTGLTTDLVTITNSDRVTVQNLTVANADNSKDNIRIDNAAKVTITKCTVENGDNNGIYASNAAKVVVKNCLIDNSGFFGVILQNVYNGSILSSSIVSSLGGILSSFSKNIYIVGNTVDNNTMGIDMESTHNSLVKKNIISKNDTGIFHAGLGAFGNVYSNNVIKEGAIYGPYGVNVLSGSPTFIKNLIFDNQTGFYSNIGSYSTIIKNTISNNSSDGFYLEDSSGYLVNNNITGNTQRGVRQSITTTEYLPSRTMILTGNKITDNGNWGVTSRDNTGKTLLEAEKNYVVGNQGYGIEYDSVQGAILDKNTIGITNGHGIELYNHTGTLTKNLVYANIGRGIHTGSYSLISGNNVHDNDDSGISGFSGSYVFKNTVLSNGSYGIDASNGNNSLIENNKAYGNTTFDLYDTVANDHWMNNKFGTASPFVNP